MTIEERAVREEITTLGLVKQTAEPTILALLQKDVGEHPAAICTRYRREGEQVSEAEKRQLGVRTNGFLSRAALAEITEEGRREPLRAHELTLLRATFTVRRDRAVGYARLAVGQVGPGSVRIIHETLSNDCAACNELDGRSSGFDDAAIIPPAGCRAPCTANYGLRVSVDWLANLD